MIATLENLLLEAEEAMSSDLRTRLLWLESLSTALGGEAASNLGEDAARAALDVRAAIGALIVYSQGSRSEDELVAVDVAVHALTRRALATIYGGLSNAYRQLSQAGAHRRECQALARLFNELKRAVHLGRPPSPNTLRRLEALRLKMASRIE